MKLILASVLILGTLACALLAAGAESDWLAWNQFKGRYGKVYASPEEEARRFGIFVENKQLVELHNANASRSYSKALNYMADWTPQEKARLSGAFDERASYANLLAWRRFKKQHGKVYDSQEEESKRFGIFLENKQLVERHNANASHSYTLALNHMADWMPDERARLQGAKLPVEQQFELISDEELAEIIARNATVPDELDWRKQGRVSGIKNQKMCGASWAFATTALLEGQQKALNMSSLVTLSEQQLIDCDKSNKGCLGGWPSAALDELAQKLGGIESDLDYPYWGNDEDCRVDRKKFSPVKVKGHKMLPSGDEKTLKQVVANYGPVAVSFMKSADFYLYDRGILDNQDCVPKYADQSALVVGYGKDAKVGDYWIIKNSWGTGWGIKGYLLFKAGTNMCNIADYPTVAVF